MTVAADLLSKVLSDTPIDDAILDAIALSACADGVTNVELVAILRIARELPSLRDRPPAGTMTYRLRRINVTFRPRFDAARSASRKSLQLLQ